MSEEDVPKTKAEEEKEDKIASDAADYIYEEILGGAKKEEEVKEEPSTAEVVKEYVSDTVTAGQEFVAGLGAGTSTASK